MRCVTSSMRRACRLAPLLRGSSSVRRDFHSQHRTPIIPQVKVTDKMNAPLAPVRVGYLLQRSQVVKHAPHPLETEMSYLLEREHQRYSRHEGVESATHFMNSRGQTMDLLGRHDANQIKANFFGLELYQDAMKVVLQRYTPEPRVTPNDLYNPEELTDRPPARHTLHRKLDDYLYLIVREKASDRWTLPYATRAPKETLRMTVDRAIAEQHAEGLDTYVWSNAPQATVLLPGPEKARLFIYAATYLSGRPRFEGMVPECTDHAWATRSEMLQYREAFVCPELLEAVRDVAVDGLFESL